jgi:PTH1 family peptidyl-tRNA hydrolase
VRLHTPIKLIVGLGNPGSEYAETRHNVGAWLVEQLAEQQQQKLRVESKFKARVTRLRLAEHECWLLIPTTYMNHSGDPVQAFSHFHKISPEEILVAHDELDFPTGIVRLKKDGGAGGRNGLKDILAQLSTPNFYRLRIGIGHPGDRNKVIDYVLSSPSRADNKLITQAIDQAISVMPDLISGHFQKAVRELHTARVED